MNPFTVLRIDIVQIIRAQVLNYQYFKYMLLWTDEEGKGGAGGHR